MTFSCLIFVMNFFSYPYLFGGFEGGGLRQVVTWGLGELCVRCFILPSCAPLLHNELMSSGSFGSHSFGVVQEIIFDLMCCWLPEAGCMSFSVSCVCLQSPSVTQNTLLKGKGCNLLKGQLSHWTLGHCAFGTEVLASYIPACGELRQGREIESLSP